MADTSPLLDSDGLPALVEGLPNICGWEAEIETIVAERSPVFLPRTDLRLSDVSAGFAIALHMHQPMIPAGRSGALINNLQHMLERPYEGDNYNAGHFAYCYGRIGDFVPELVSQGCSPRIMLDYTGTLLWGLQSMGRADILDKLKRVTCDTRYQPYVEWLGTFWGHAVADAIPIEDIRLQIQTWQHHFAAIFGPDALRRIRGFSLPEMQLPSHPETLYRLINELRSCGYEWLLVKESELETKAGGSIPTPNVPYKLIAQSAAGETTDITVLVQSQNAQSGSVARMKPYDEAKDISPTPIKTKGSNDKTIPSLVIQIDDGENEGKMMNEFPSAFKRTWYAVKAARQGCVAFCGTEYLELLMDAGLKPEEFPSCRRTGSQMLENGLAQEQVTVVHHAPIERLSQRFHTVVSERAELNLTKQHRYRNALLHNLLLQTSCFRSWGEGEWTDYAQEIYRRGLAILEHDF